MIVIFCGIIILLDMADAGNRFRAKKEIIYANQIKPFLLNILLLYFSAPQETKP